MFKHFIITRFFSDDGPIMVSNINFEYYFNIFKCALFNSLLNFTSYNFELIILVHNTVEDNVIKPLYSLNAPFKITILRKFMLNNYLNKFIFLFLNIIESRCDIDDYINKNLIIDTQLLVKNCDSILLYGYISGYGYISWNKLFYYFTNSCHNIGHWSCLSSLIFNTKFIIDNKLTELNIYSFNHGRSKMNLLHICNRNNILYSDKMFSINNTITDAFIYVRHDSSWSELNNPAPHIIPRHMHGSCNNISLTDFGCSYDNLLVFNLLMYKFK